MKSVKVLLIVLLVGALNAPFAAPLSTALTYQGNLNDGGGPADGPYDFEFQLWDSLTNGVQVGPTVTADDVNVVAGIFTARMDFGNGPFVGDDLWLLVRVRLGASVGGYTELLPRQAITPAPFALHAEFVPAGSISNLEIDTSTVQARVTSDCPSGEHLVGIDVSGAVSCDPDTDTTYAAGSGLGLAGTTFSVDTSTVQARVTSGCPAGEHLVGIDVSGAVSCDPDTDTTYAAGSGLGLAGTTFSVDTSTVQARVTSGCPPGEHLVGIKVSGEVSCDPDTDTNTTYTAGSGLSLTGTTFSSDTTGTINSGTAPAPAGTNFGAQTAEWLGFRFRIIPEPGGQGTNDGRLEFSNNGGVTWGTVCDDSFASTASTARVVCRSMGYADGVPRSAANTTDGIGLILLDDFGCHENARTLLECRIRPIGSENCAHAEDVGVTCSQ